MAEEISPGVVELNLEEGRAMLDLKTRGLLRVDLEGFERLYDAGELWRLDADECDIDHCVMLLPFARDINA